jgi:hypothetical protein
MTSRSKKARVAGLLYIVASVVGVFRLLYIPTVLTVHGNATATANNIAAHEALFAWVLSANCSALLCGFSFRWLFTDCSGKSTRRSLS